MQVDGIRGGVALSDIKEGEELLKLPLGSRDWQHQFRGSVRRGHDLRCGAGY
jgi:hypothetical protein